MALLMLLPVPAVAAAKVRYTGEIKIAGSNGFKLSFEPSVDRGETTVTVAAVRDDERPELAPPQEAAFYASHRSVRVSQRAFAFQLPDGLGSARLRLDVKRVDRNEGRRCTSRTLREGVFSGSLDFTGEGGYTEVHTRRVKGSIIAFHTRRPCEARARAPYDIGRQDEEEEDIPALVTCGPGKRLGLLAGGGVDTRAFFFAATTEWSRDLSVLRLAYAPAPRSALVFNDARTEATLQPSAPFSGSAIWADGRLTGDIAVTFPGAPDVALAPVGASLLDPDENLPECFPYQPN